MDFTSQHPSKLRFENTKNKKNAQVNLAFFLFYYLLVSDIDLFSNQMLEFITHFVENMP